MKNRLNDFIINQVGLNFVYQGEGFVIQGAGGHEKSFD
jgi:hypothetical protein